MQDWHLMRLKSCVVLGTGSIEEERENAVVPFCVGRTRAGRRGVF